LGWTVLWYTKLRINIDFMKFGTSSFVYLKIHPKQKSGRKEGKRIFCQITFLINSFCGHQTKKVVTGLLESITMDPKSCSWFWLIFLISKSIENLYFKMVFPIEKCTPHNLANYAKSEDFDPAACDAIINNVIDSECLLNLEKEKEYEIINLSPQRGDQFVKNIMVH
jgi:hypothetical protein